MIKLRHAQPTVWEGLFAEEVAELVGTVDGSGG